MARYCKMCGGQYSLSNALGDGLCVVCRQKKAEQEIQNATTEATKKIYALLQETVPDEQWELVGLAIWSTARHRMSQTKNLWVGRAFLGILADITHTETSLLGVLGVSTKGTLSFIEIGETVSISPQDVLVGKVVPETAIVIPLQDVTITHTSEQTIFLENLPGDKYMTLIFPKCFLDGNEDVPEKLTRWGQSTTFHIDQESRDSNGDRVICAKCSNFEFNFDPYWNEYTCKKCGWQTKLT
jgi:hypothetical protein